MSASGSAPGAKAPPDPPFGFPGLEDRLTVTAGPFMLYEAKRGARAWVCFHVLQTLEEGIEWGHLRTASRGCLAYLLAAGDARPEASIGFSLDWPLERFPFNPEPESHDDVQLEQWRAAIASGRIEWWSWTDEP